MRIVSALSYSIKIPINHNMRHLAGLFGKTTYLSKFLYFYFTYELSNPDAPIPIGRTSSKWRIFTPSKFYEAFLRAVFICFSHDTL